MIIFIPFSICFSFCIQRDVMLISDVFPVMVDDALLSSHPIIVDVSNPAEITSVFDGISYSKVLYSGDDVKTTALFPNCPGNELSLLMVSIGSIHFKNAGGPAWPRNV